LEDIHTGLRLKGQMLHDAQQNLLFFLGSPWVTDVAQLNQWGLSVSDFAPHDHLVDCLFLLQTQKNTLQDLRNLTEQLSIQSAQLQQAHAELEQKVIERTAALAQTNTALQESEERLRLALQASSTGIWDWNILTGEIIWSPEPEVMNGFAPGTFEGTMEAFLQAIHPDDRKIVIQAVSHAVRECSELHMEFRILRPDGTVRWDKARGCVLCDESGRPVRILGVSTDITEHKTALEKIRRQFERLSALRAIDASMAANMDLRVTLNLLLDQVTSQLGVDAACILLLNAHNRTLEYFTGRGFLTKEITHSRLWMGDGLGRMVALEGKCIELPDPLTGDEVTLRAPWAVEEGFTNYYAMPLITKGYVRGVLEIFHRSTLQTDAEWLEYLATLAGQAAIAIDNTVLFENLQRSNAELVMSYDTTLEGWVKALDLRDNETKGHTQRVTEMTLRLARAMGVGEEELVHIRRGALLHDIGKIGIPDNILHKAGPLNDQEWAIMRKHPEYAYEWLSPIPYLRPALDIPYAHHEKWDGSGYPRGLKGKQIPLAARIFAVVDVWDALTSDRPYRKGWPEAKAIEYIRSLAGRHFDPEVVEVFLHVLLTDESTRSHSLCAVAA